jgi:membrane protease YdiL (CAAX protease family)
MSKETRQRKDLPRTAVRRPVSPQTSARQRPRKQTGDDTPPTLSVIDARMEKRARLFSSSVRLMPMAALGIVVFTVLMIAMIILGKTGQLGISLSYNVGVEEYGLFSILSIGLIPILTASVMILMFRPTSAYVLGLAPVTTSCVSASFAGFLIGMFIWCATQLISTFDAVFVKYLALPAIWENSLFYFGRTALSSLTVLLAAVLMPAVSIELLARGLIQQAFTLSGSHSFSSVVISSLFALTFFDLNGLFILILWGIVSFWIRHRTDSLIASSLGTASFALAMIFSRPIFTAIGQLLFRMPLIEVMKVRIFLTMCCLILAVLLLIPTAIINEAGKRIADESKRLRDLKKNQKRPGKGSWKSAVSPAAHYALRIAAILCTAVLAAFMFLL